MNVYILVQHVCEADLVIGAFSTEETARAAMKAAKDADFIEGYSVELWEIDGARVSYIAHA